MALANVKKRDENIDVLKGLAIICVVLGHCGFPGSPYIYLFHMAVFFMASGYCFDAKKIQSCDNLWEYALKKLRSLWFPYVIFNTLGWIFYNTFIQIGFLTENPEFPDAVSRMEWPSIVNAIAWVFHMNTWGTQKYFGAGWFIIVLFYITILFAALCLATESCKKRVCLMARKGRRQNCNIDNMASTDNIGNTGSAGNVNEILPKTELALNILQHVILLSSGAISLYVSWKLQCKQLTLEECITSATVCYPLYVFGFYLKKLSGRINTVIWRFRYVIAVLGIPAFYIAGRYGGISLNLNTYPSWQFLLLCSLMGWVWLLALAMCFTYKKWKIKNVLTYIGKRTIYILFLHFLAFRPVVALQLMVYHEPSYLLASFPILVKGGGWWILYAIAGVGLPLLAEKIVLAITHCLHIKD